MLHCDTIFLNYYKLLLFIAILHYIKYFIEEVDYQLTFKLIRGVVS